ncbi:MAG: rhomboid family intramembrane serine protease [Gammaproteobacteria bacterium]
MSTLLTQLSDALTHIIASFQNNWFFALIVLAVLWGVQLLNVISRYKLNILGIYPRSLRGLSGIFFAPFLHGNSNHLFFNSVPLYILTILLLSAGRLHFYLLTALIIFVSGFAVWLFGKKAIHIGASGVIMGYFGYLLTNAYYHPNASTVILALLALYYFGGLALALIPSQEKNVSWSGHVFGFLAGVLGAYLL